jgi:hypothetical protein
MKREHHGVPSRAASASVSAWTLLLGLGQPLFAFVDVRGAPRAAVPGYSIRMAA